ncbi:hypothetical protein [Streptomyces xanthii]|uniref:Uncharacterized protein n=1 Tax=Streptomyces xanthii TaxID=2768069 RepID=A0A7H1B0X5_9ACTN|nr:hypothetical protein [Streptomyces xanthii]QNS02380.1 hypothetical protein IAG42_01310 [Streptomyces xanthii]
MTTHTAPEFGPPIRRIFRDVIADRVKGPHPPQAAMLFAPEADPFWKDDSGFLGDFYNDILHQDTCRPDTAAGVPLLAALACDDRVPARQRFNAVELLFCAATVAERKSAGCWPRTPPHADPDSEHRARKAVQSCTPDLLSRWPVECPAVRLALASLAVVFPTARTLPALTARLRGVVEQHPRGTDIGDHARFVLVLATRDDRQILPAVEAFTDVYWKGTARGAPTRARALHLLGQMLDRVESTLRRAHPAP